MKKDFGPIEFIPGKNFGRYPFCHSVYVQADIKVIVDPGSDRDHLRDVASKKGIDCVWLSHAHEDHFKDLDLFMDCALWAPQKGARSLESLDDLFDAYGMESGERQIFVEPMLRDFHYKPRCVERYFFHEETIDLGGVTVQVIPTPGHTAGHCSFLFPEQGVLFLGDYDLTPFGPYYGDVDSDIDETIASVNKLRSLPARVWLASHETGVFETDPGQLWDRYLNIIEEREAKLLEFLKPSPTMPQIVDACIIYGKKREPTWFFEFGERMLMGKHLERLIKQGRVALNNGSYQLIDS
jgi:glyoxylase-like metal-dependent hydrolase (beta-lactamase superfamily II)